MADNDSVFAGNAGAQILVATDDIGGVKYQRVKLAVGPDGTAVDLRGINQADGGDGSGVMPVSPVYYDGSVVRQWRTAQVVGDLAAVNVPVAGAPYLFNETTFDRQRGNTEGLLLASAARTATTTTARQTNYNHRGIFLTCIVTAAGTGTLDLRVLGTQNGDYLHAAAPTLITATGEWVIELYPGSTQAPIAQSAAVSGRFSCALPRSFYAQVIHSGASSWTYSVNYSLVL